jgi:hypothetical protein
MQAQFATTPAVLYLTHLGVLATHFSTTANLKELDQYNEILNGPHWDSLTPEEADQYRVAGVKSVDHYNNDVGIHSPTDDPYSADAELPLSYCLALVQRGLRVDAESG